jgi:hypothetical protein
VTLLPRRHADLDNNDWVNSITDSYEELLLEQLQDPEQAIGYLNAALADPDPRVFSLALQDVVNSRSPSEPFGEDMASVKSVLERLGFELRVAASSPVG